MDFLLLLYVLLSLLPFFLTSPSQLDCFELVLVLVRFRFRSLFEGVKRGVKWRGGTFLARIDGIFNGLAVSNSFPNAFCADSLRFIRVASGRQLGP